MVRIVLYRTRMYPLTHLTVYLLLPCTALILLCTGTSPLAMIFPQCFSPSLSSLLVLASLGVSYCISSCLAVLTLTPCGVARPVSVLSCVVCSYICSKPMMTGGVHDGGTAV